MVRGGGASFGVKLPIQARGFWTCGGRIRRRPDGDTPLDPQSKGLPGRSFAITK